MAYINTYPEPSEYLEYYYQYIKLVDNNNILNVYEEQLNDLNELIQIAPDKGNYRYDEDKWSIKEVIGHLIDNERIFAYRILRISRNDNTPLPGYEQNLLIIESTFNKRDLSSLIEEWQLVRKSNIYLIKSLTDKQLKRIGTVSDNKITVKALVYIIPGHFKHHLDVIKTRYLKLKAKS